ncbi:MAG: hypothetical protein PQ612_04800 [Rickettsiales bacterium]|nr:hypothetical protein [Pseudomonadota bacterium]MDA0966339.1 hypothetical protein [Pseudomonadota bacterium]MDG4543971.1 hypothetical protein [Rickettsiales bacterium]MDG4545465.1 hypothetical protein [Rickettsiales bacterium]MDG4547914.1 hypothetical protein [Rickettsiales bacterium]
MTKAKLNDIPFIGEFLTGQRERSGDKVRNAEGKEIEPKVTPAQMEAALQIQKEQSSDGKAPFILNVLSENAEALSKVEGGKQFESGDVWQWKKDFLPLQSSLRAKAAEEDIQNLDQIDPESLKTQDWMYNARTDQPSAANSASALANVSNLVVRLAKEAKESGEEIHHSIKTGVSNANRLTQSLVNNDTGQLMNQDPNKLLMTVKSALRDVADLA